MKINKKALIAAAAFSASINLNGCVYGPPYDPADNIQPGVYGPPPVAEYQEIENNNEQTDHNSEESHTEADGTENTKE
ncbi:MAG: hypothetical protein J1F09_08550 [Oscillospiraceae bacterium]|nr:hypothetical protein [Oscillospiraceae bacterium]